MHRKVQVFSMPAKVSIGQGRNKKDPQRGRKRITTRLSNALVCIEIKKIPKGDGNRLFNRKQILLYIEIKKIPKGDGNAFLTLALVAIKPDRNKKDPHRGRSFFSCDLLNL